MTIDVNVIKYLSVHFMDGCRHVTFDLKSLN